MDDIGPPPGCNCNSIDSQTWTIGRRIERRGRDALPHSVLRCSSQRTRQLPPYHIQAIRTRTSTNYSAGATNHVVDGWVHCPTASKYPKATWRCATVLTESGTLPTCHCGQCHYGASATQVATGTSTTNLYRERTAQPDTHAFHQSWARVRVNARRLPSQRRRAHARKQLIQYGLDSWRQLFGGNSP